MTICPKCELPIVEGDHVRLQVLAVFHKAPIPGTHAIDLYEEEWLQHLLCSQAAEGD